MVNAQYLEEVIGASGKKKSYLAQKCGVSRQCFNAKCKNKTDFKTSEVQILCEELGITSLKEKEKIFFCL
jgi:hypothetical protein